MTCVVLICMLFFPADCFAQTQTASTARENVADNEYQTGAILWTQSSAEYRALAYQAFSLARLQLDQMLQNQKKSRAGRRASKPLAVVVDVDETVLDNSRYQAELVLRGVAYSTETWQAWCDRAEAGAVPGAVEFLKYAANRGVHVFYITNRREPEKAGTISNLSKLGFPGVNEETVMIRVQGATASKESRRDQVRSRYQIALLIGDNLNDFTDDFAGKSIAGRSAEVDRQRSEFGLRFIAVPNPMYGDWESAVYENKPNLSDAEKRTLRRTALTGISVQSGP